MGGAADLPPVDRGKIPGNAEAWRAGRHGAAVVDPHPLEDEVVKLRDILDPAAVWDGRGQRDVQLHEEVRADGDVEGFGEVRRLQPRRDAADAGDVDLDDAR